MRARKQIPNSLYVSSYLATIKDSDSDSDQFSLTGISVFGVIRNYIPATSPTILPWRSILPILNILDPERFTDTQGTLQTVEI